MTETPTDVGLNYKNIRRLGNFIWSPALAFFSLAPIIIVLTDDR